jgi:hypothetical protein
MIRTDKAVGDEAKRLGLGSGPRGSAASRGSKRHRSRQKIEEYEAIEDRGVAAVEQRKKILRRMR